MDNKIIDCCYAECLKKLYAECRYAECHYAECRGARKWQKVGLKS
jgi:hypothetical protein